MYTSDSHTAANLVKSLNNLPTAAPNMYCKINTWVRNVVKVKPLIGARLARAEVGHPEEDATSVAWAWSRAAFGAPRFLTVMRSLLFPNA